MFQATRKSRSRSSSSSSSSSDDEKRSHNSLKKKVSKGHGCHCTVIHKESSAVISNIVLEATVDLSVVERIKIDVPVKTHCQVRSMSKKPVVTQVESKPVVQQERSVPEQQPVQKRKSLPKPKVEQKPMPEEHAAKPPPLIKEVFKIIVEVNDLPKMDSFLNGGSADPYFYFYLDNKLYFGGRDKAIKNSRKGQWSFPILASLVRNAHKITIKWFDFDSVGKDDEIGTTELDINKAIRHILSGTSNKCVTNFLNINGKGCEKASVSVTVTKE